MDINNQEKILEIKRPEELKAKAQHRENIFGVEVSIGDKELDGVLDYSKSREKESVKSLLLHNQEFDLGV